jgi:restriction system protein
VAARRRTNYRRPARRTTYRKRTTKPRSKTSLRGLAIIGAILVTISNPAVGIPLLIVILAGIFFFTPSIKHRPRLAPRSARRIIPTAGTNYLTLTPKQFEHALADLCRRDGCTRVQVVGGAGDLGADVICTTPDGRRLVIQAKRYAATTKVGSGDVQKVGGTARQIHGADIAAVVTTSTFTPAAANYARQVGIRTVDGAALTRWAGRTGPAPWQ